MTAGRGYAGLIEARQLIGRRVAWPREHLGTIVDITTTRNGYVYWVVEWDPGTPDWWATIVSPRSGVVLIPIDGIP